MCLDQPWLNHVAIYLLISFIYKLYNNKINKQELPALHALFYTCSYDFRVDKDNIMQLQTLERVTVISLTRPLTVYHAEYLQVI